MREPVISIKAARAISDYVGAVREYDQAHKEHLDTYGDYPRIYPGPRLAGAIEAFCNHESSLKRYIARLESKADYQERELNKLMGKKYQAVKRTDMSEDDLTEFYRLLYAWEDARDEYMKTLGGMTFDQDDVKAKAAASVEAKAQLEDFVKGLCKREEVTE